MEAIIALEDGRIFRGRSFTGPGEAWGEVVFNTGMTGYQEVLTDPSYNNQLVTMTYPLIGNYGINNEDAESDRIQVSGFLLREHQKYPNNFRSQSTLAEYMIRAGQGSRKIIGIDQIDTRALTRHIRNAGAMRAFISTENYDPELCINKAKNVPAVIGRDCVAEVTTDTPYRWIGGKRIPLADESFLNVDIWKNKTKRHSVAVLDYGVKYNILRCLEHSDCEIIVLPAKTAASSIINMEPDGIFLSNGPGDPEPVIYAVETVRELLGYRPVFGICLGLQIIGLALGGETFKLKFGHRGANQPVKNLLTGKIEITSQNHGFAIDRNSLEDNQVEVTHVNLNDNTVEGFRHRKLPVQAVQYHPEASPGPHDARYFFDKFIQSMSP